MKEDVLPKDVLKRGGLKCTNQRVMVIKQLLRKKSPMTAEEIFSNLSVEGDRINLSTIYRILETFFENRMVLKHPMAEGKAKCYELDDGGKTHQHSIICTDCRKTVRVKECPVDRMAENLMESDGFEITEHHIQIFGRCKDCRKIKETKEV